MGLARDLHQIGLDLRCTGIGLTPDCNRNGMRFKWVHMMSNRLVLDWRRIGARSTLDIGIKLGWIGTRLVLDSDRIGMDLSKISAWRLWH